MAAELHVADPATPSRVGVVVLHDWYGLLPHDRAFADRLADEGFAAVAVDYYGGRATRDAGEAEQFAEALTSEEAATAARSGADALRSRGIEKLAVLGFSLGGSIAISNAPGLGAHAVVLYYAGSGHDPSQLTVPVLGHFAEKDEFEPREDVEKFFAGVRDQEHHFYPGTQHSFANADIPHLYNEAAAEQAWERTLAVLRKLR